MKRKKKRKSSCPRGDLKIVSKKRWIHVRLSVFIGKKAERERCQRQCRYFYEMEVLRVQFPQFDKVKLDKSGKDES
jgi:hypothetical protein